MNKSKGLARLATAKGFTIIELAIVIAIIAILAAIVLINIPQYIAKGKNSAIQGDMIAISTNAATWNDRYSTYVGFAADTTYLTPKNQINSYLSSMSCSSSNTCVVENESDTAFCACTPLLDVNGAVGQTFCVDSVLNKKQTGTPCATECLASGACQ